MSNLFELFLEGPVMRRRADRVLPWAGRRVREATVQAVRLRQGVHAVSLVARLEADAVLS